MDLISDDNVSLELTPDERELLGRCLEIAYEGCPDDLSEAIKILMAKVEDL